MKSFLRLTAVAACIAGAAPADAQLASPTLSDATIVSRGAFRFRSGVEWTRIDGVFGPGGASVLPIGSTLTGELNSTNLPLLLTGEDAARTMAGNANLTFSAGQLTTSVDSRIASVPLSVEYGVTSRFTLGVLVPIVQSRSTVTSQLNGPNGVANVGTNPAAFHGSLAARNANATVANGLTTARDQLAQQVANCAASPGSPGCAALNARAAEANALLTASTDFTFALETLYGVSDDKPGSPFVPIAGSVPQIAIDNRLATLRASYASFGISSGSAALAPAQAPAANAQLGDIVSSPDFGIELDSIAPTQQTAVGDIELSLTTLLFNSFGDTTRHLRVRGVAAGVVRLGTGKPARANRPFDVPTGDGQTDLEARGALDVLVGSRLLATLAATYTLQMGSVETTRLPYAPGSVLALDFPVSGSIKPGNMMSARLNPRFLFTPALQVGALGVVSYRSADEVTVTGFAPVDVIFGNPSSFMTTAAGLTISYSSLTSETGTGSPRFPAEIVFTHLETLTASEAGAVKDYRDSIELRYFFRARR